jgi:hypothetical protein
MKSLLFLFAITFFFSCDSGIDSNESVTANGSIRKIEMSTWQYGTHTLIDSNSKPLYALTSSVVDLDLYQNKQVRISGNLVKGYPVDGGPKYLNVISIYVMQ